MRPPPPKHRAVLSFLLAIVLFPSASAVVHAEGTDSPLLSLPAYEVSVHSPVIRGRQDEAFRRALSSAFRKVVESSLRELAVADRDRTDFVTWQRNILSRSQDFIASYQVRSHSVREGYLTLTVRARVQFDKLEKAFDDSMAMSAPLMVRVLVIVEPFAMMGTAYGEDFDAGHEAANALQIALLKQGAILIPPPERTPWGNDGGNSTENRISLATTAAGKLGADYVLTGRLSRRTDSLLVLSVELISVASERVLATVRSPVELQSNVPPQEYFIRPAEEIAHLFLAKLR